MKSVDQRLASVLLFLCRNSGYSPETLKRKDGRFLLSDDIEEIKELKETVKYLKNYAKIQALSRAIGDSGAFAEEIKIARENILRQIEEKENEYRNLPRKKSLAVKESHLYGYEEQIADEKKKTATKFNEELDAKRNHIKNEIKSLRERLKELDLLEKNVGKPSKIMELLFEKERMASATEYQRLIDLCARVITSGFDGKVLIGEGKPFTYDKETDTYTINPKEAKKYITTVKKGRAIIACSEYIGAKRKEEETRESIQKEETAVAERTELQGNFGSKEFTFIHDSINKIISEYNSILEIEERKSDRSIVNKIRELFGRRPRYITTRKTLRARKELEETIQDFLTKVKSDKKLRSTYSQYVGCRGTIIGQEHLTGNNLEIAARNLFSGISRFDLPREQISSEDVKMAISNSIRKSTSRIAKLNEEVAQQHDRTESLHQGLSKTAIKLLEENPEEEILSIHEKYYSKSDRRKAANARQTISSSAAIMILESLVSGRKISFEELCGNFEQVLGKSSVNAERNDMEQELDDKIERLKARIRGLSILSQPSQEVEK